MRVLHFKLISSPVCYFQTWHCGFAAAGVHCQLSLSHLQIEIDLADCEPQAARWTLSDAEEPPVRRVVTWSIVACLCVPRWRDAEGAALQFNRRRFLIRSTPAGPVSAVCPSSAIRYPFCYFIPLIMCCATSWLLLNFLPWSESQYWHWL